jgi:hypothetical protein
MLQRVPQGFEKICSFERTEEMMFDSFLKRKKEKELKNSLGEFSVKANAIADIETLETGWLTENMSADDRKKLNELLCDCYLKGFQLSMRTAKGIFERANNFEKRVSSLEKMNEQ